MGYYIDLESVSIEQYMKKLEMAYLPPSRLVLKERVVERFTFFMDMGIQNVNQLIQLLKKKDSFIELQKVDCLSGDYLVLLKRELNSMLPKPIKIGEFLGISAEAVQKLEKIGIKNTVKLYGHILRRNQRKEIARRTEIAESTILELAKLTDLSRIKWVGATFASMLYMLGYDTVEKVANADPVKLHSKVNELNKEKGFYKAQIGLNDINIVVAIAKDIPVEIDV